VIDTGPGSIPDATKGDRGQKRQTLTMDWRDELKSKYCGLMADCRGPACLDGWRVPIEEAVAQIAVLVPHARISQIEQKLGGLRVCIQDVPDHLFGRVDAIVQEAAERAWRTCETCGAPGRLYDEKGVLAACCERHAVGRPMGCPEGSAPVPRRSRCVKNARISSRTAMVGWPASSIRWAVTTLWHATRCAKKGATSVFCALSGGARPTKRSPSAAAR
jgi:hypothetical protein